MKNEIVRRETLQKIVKDVRNSNDGICYPFLTLTDEEVKYMQDFGISIEVEKVELQGIFSNGYYVNCLKLRKEIE